MKSKGTSIFIDYFAIALNVDSYNSVQFLFRKLKKSEKPKNFDIFFFFAYFCRAIAKTLFLRGRLGARCFPMQSFAFPNIILFPKILSSKWFGNLFGNSCIKFLF